MIVIHPEYIFDEKQDKKSVVLPFREWEQILDEIEELDDIRAYDKAKAENDEIIPFEIALQEIQRGKL